MKYFVECCGCDYRNGKTKGVNMGLGVENSVKSGRESDLSVLRNPNWKPGQKFDTSILDNVTRESVESTLVKNGNRLVRNSIDVSV